MSVDLAKIKEDMYANNLIKKIDVGMTLKINLGNYETADLYLTYTLENPTLEQERNAFTVVRATLAGQADTTRKQVQAQREASHGKKD